MTSDMLAALLSERRAIFLVSAGDPYIGIGFARDFIAWARAQSRVVVGLEGFNTDGRSLYPLLDYIANVPEERLSTADPANSSADSALRILAEWERTGGPEFVEFVLEERR
jgi:hypothetical protein